MRSKELKTAMKAAKVAGRLVLKHFNKPLLVSYKEKNEIVTNVDKLSQSKIIKIIKRSFPTHSIWSEEMPELKTNSDYEWIIDPLDGTLSYSKKIPFFAISIALEYKHKPVIGVVFSPMTKELFWAEKGRGAFLNNKPIRVSKNRSKKRLFFVSTEVFESLTMMKRFHKRLKDRTLHLRSFGVSALELCWLTKCRADACYEYNVKPGDIAAAILIVREAGGKVLTPQKRNATSKNKNVIAVSSLSSIK